ncbi:M15 family metallopeptidase [Curtobacterium sp. RHCJP20]|uniref:M15 family metallopeptidase n=1 Tax=Curtobacterium subtropicum TaxID=3055138 RepID=A0ABT7TFZ6_9MICO|nr:M15 family metallopeptidase [Curtobacterium subtropicum]MDM7888498.1 M15 family metallopeptidase [Curtobacterium subtropicum]
MALTIGGGRATAATVSPVVDANLYDLGASMPEGDGARATARAAATSAWGGYSNGQIPASAMTKVPVSVGQPYLRGDAAAAYNDLNRAFQARFGKSLSITEAYRDLARQRALYAAYQAGTGSKAAVPGTSVHGWALACDFGSGVASGGSAEKQWANANGPKFGWQPVGDSFGEAWHFEYDGSYQGSGSGSDRSTDDDMRVIQSAGRGIALIGSGYFYQLPEGEFVSAATKLWGDPFIGNDRQFDLWRAMVLQGTTA